MSGTAELVERLRLPVSESMFARKTDMLRALFEERSEAASTIERLERARDEARRARDTWRKSFSEMHRQAMAAEAEASRLRERVAEMLAALKEAETEIRELREWVDRHVPAEVVASEKWAELHKPAVTTTVLRNLRTAIAKAEGR